MTETEKAELTELFIDKVSRLKGKLSNSFYGDVSAETVATLHVFAEMQAEIIYLNERYAKVVTLLEKLHDDSYERVGGELRGRGTGGTDTEVRNQGSTSLFSKSGRDKEQQRIDETHKTIA